jgi:1-acyl-sn-glycerol-3-phosphate acyltransferase
MASTALPPAKAGWLLNRAATLLFRLTGWKAEGTFPPLSHFVVIAAPHTSYWDAIFMIAVACIYNIRFSWMVKDSAMFFPLSVIVRYFGGVPIDRSTRRDVVGQAVDRFASSETFYLAVSPDGTREYCDHWKSGFYHIARAARVPIVFGYVDFARKATGLGPVFHPTGNIDADFKVFERFYAQVTPRYPQCRGRVVPRVQERDSAA